MSPSYSSLHRTIWFVVGVTLIFCGSYVTVTEAYVKHDAIHDLFISKSDIFLYGGSVAALGAVILLLVLFFWGIFLWRRPRMRKGSVSYEVVG